jgi:hypothetical protein
MGMDLVRRRDSIKWTCNNQLWIYILDSAESVGWKPMGVRYKAELNGADPLDYYSHNGQTVSPEDSENLHLSLVKFLEKEDPVGVEKYIIEDFINWVVRRNDDGTIMDIPGFLIR